MSLHPHASYPVPDDTQRIARAAFPHGNIYMQVAAWLGTTPQAVRVARHSAYHSLRTQRRLPAAAASLPSS